MAALSYIVLTYFQLGQSEYQINSAKQILFLIHPFFFTHDPFLDPIHMPHSDMEMMDVINWQLSCMKVPLCKYGMKSVLALGDGFIVDATYHFSAIELVLHSLA